MEASRNIAKDVEAVVTSFNQGTMIMEAVRSLCEQTTPPARVIIVDDGSTDEESLEVLKKVETIFSEHLPITLMLKLNGGVSAARNTGIAETKTPLVLVLDGDDRLEPSYIEKVCQLLRNDSCMVAASSWMQTFGVLNAVVRPCGGGLNAFLSKNCCAATHSMRRKYWEKCGGYDENMRSGFEDWEFFLSMLETEPNMQIGVVQEPLIDYRTAPASSNITSMEKRLDLMRFIIEKHLESYRNHVEDAVIGVESTSMTRLFGWEGEIIRSMRDTQELSKVSDEFIKHPTYGDGGMAAAVRIVSSKSEMQSLNEKQ